MFTYHSVETCSTFRSYSSTFSYNDGITAYGYPEASTFTDSGASQSREDYGASFYSSMSETQNDGGSFPQTYWFAYGIKDGGSTSSTTFSQSWEVTSTLSTQSASQTSYTFSSRNSRAQGTSGIVTISSYPATSTSGSTSKTFQKIRNGVASVETSYTFSAHSTETYVFSETLGIFSINTTTSQLTGTASATRTVTATRSLSASGKTTAYLFGGALHAQILLNTRRALPPLRPVAPGLAATGAVTASFLPVVTLSESQVTWPKSLYSSEATSSTSSSSLTTGAIRTTSHYTTSSFEKFSVTSFASSHVSVRTMALSAQRRSLVIPEDGDGVLFVSLRSDSQSFYTALTISPAELSDTSFGETTVQILANNVCTPLIYTSTRSGLSVGGSSASAAWTYVSSDWKLRVTKRNSVTSTTLFATLGFSGSAETTTQNATAAIVTATGNITSAVLGPLLPLTISSLNTVSVTLRESANSTNPFFGRSFVQSSSAATEASYSTSNSSSSAHQMGTAGTFPWTPITFPESRITGHKAMRAVSLSTASTTVQTGHTVSFPATAKNAKWNEAGRSDVVSVVE